MLCDCILDIDCPNYVCTACEPKIAFIDTEICGICGRPVENEGICAQCIETRPLFDRNISIFVYDEAIREVIHKFKYGKRPSFGKALGAVLAKRAVSLWSPLISGADCIVPVPIHKNRMRRRGFNQCQLLAVELSKAAGVPLWADAVIRHKDTAPQSLVDKKDKWENVKDAFRIRRGYSFHNKTVILVDDIFTTGSTLNAVSKLLKEEDAFQIICITLSITS